jgi:hypothetical protein
MTEASGRANATIVLAALAAGQFVMALDGSIMNVSIPVVAERCSSSIVSLVASNFAREERPRAHGIRRDTCQRSDRVPARIYTRRQDGDAVPVTAPSVMEAEQWAHRLRRKT